LPNQKQTIGCYLAQISLKSNNEFSFFEFDDNSENNKNLLLTYLNLAIREGELKKPSEILEQTNCKYMKGHLSDGYSKGYFCTIGALAHDIFGWKGKAEKSYSDWKY
jgi:hypothetical protein